MTDGWQPATAYPDPAIITLDRRFEAIRPPMNAAVERLYTGCRWSEGPVWMHEDGSVLWSDIPANRMLRWHPRDGTSVWRERVEFTNGHTREADGALLHCSHGQRAIVRTRLAVILRSSTAQLPSGRRRFVRSVDVMLGCCRSPARRSGRRGARREETR